MAALDEESSNYLHHLMEEAIKKLNTNPAEFQDKLTIISPSNYHMTVPPEIIRDSNFMREFLALKRPSLSDYSNLYRKLDTLKKHLDGFTFTVKNIHISPNGSCQKFIFTFNMIKDNRSSCENGIVIDPEEDCFHVTIAKANLTNPSNPKDDPIGRYFHSLRIKLYETLEGKRYKVLKALPQGHLNKEDQDFISEICTVSSIELKKIPIIPKFDKIKILKTKEYFIAFNKCLTGSNTSTHSFRPSTLPECEQDYLSNEVQSLSQTVSSNEYQIDQVRTFKDETGICHLALTLKLFVPTKRSRKRSGVTTFLKSPCCKVKEKYSPLPYIEIAHTLEKCKEANQYLEAWVPFVEKNIAGFSKQPLNFPYLAAYRKGSNDPLYVAQ